MEINWKSLDTYDLPKLNQEDTRNIHRSTTNKIETVIKTSPY
jgi:hypothetical protein